MEIEKNRKTAGADERSPSRPQYFSWINNTNEGSTEEQTLINLDYFAYLKDTYGMQLDIYAWDAGNLDGARETYETLDSPKLTAQFPNTYAPIAEKCKYIKDNNVGGIFYWQHSYDLTGNLLRVMDENLNQ